MCIKKVFLINLKFKIKGWFLLVWVFFSDKSINYLKFFKVLFMNCLVYFFYIFMFGVYINYVI